MSIRNGVQRRSVAGMTSQVIGLEERSCDQCPVTGYAVPVGGNAVPSVSGPMTIHRQTICHPSGLGVLLAIRQEL